MAISIHLQEERNVLPSGFLECLLQGVVEVVDLDTTHSAHGVGMGEGEDMTTGEHVLYPCSIHASDQVVKRM